MNDYHKFIGRKSQYDAKSGFDPVWVPDFLFDFQKKLIEWACQQGRGALFEECGLGKTPQALVWAQNVVQRINKPILILTPLAVGGQFVREGQKFGIECEQSKDGNFKKKIVVSNYERLHYFDANDFCGVVADESGILKNFDGKTKNAVQDFIRKLPYRLLASATPAPNDYIELGNSSESLGHLGYIDMLQMFFKSDNNSFAQGGAKRYSNNPFGGKFRFKGHSERDFWRWVCSWARAIQKPSDLGFDDGKFVLPELETRQHVVSSRTKPDGWLFSVPATNLFEQRAERRRTLQERCEKAAEIILLRNECSIAWCYLNPEGDLLEEMIPGCVQISGQDSLEEKEEAIDAFQRGEIKRLISKPEICGAGLNLQICAHQTWFPSHSFEQFHQGVRRSLRFGQDRKVVIDIITSEGESRVLENLNRKRIAADRMFAKLVELMTNQLTIQKSQTTPVKINLPSFLK